MSAILMCQTESEMSNIVRHGIAMMKIVKSTKKIVALAFVLPVVFEITVSVCSTVGNGG